MNKINIHQTSVLVNNMLVSGKKKREYNTFMKLYLPVISSSSLMSNAATSKEQNTI